jgi:hypothetical protein
VIKYTWGRTLKLKTKKKKKKKKKKKNHTSFYRLNSFQKKYPKPWNYVMDAVPCAPLPLSLVLGLLRSGKALLSHFGSQQKQAKHAG